MSEYGKKWEEIRKIREEIKFLIPCADTNSFDSTKKSIELHKTVLNTLLDKWKSLES